MKKGSVVYFRGYTGEDPDWSSYLVVISGADEVKAPGGYGVGTAIALTTGAPELTPPHVVIEGADVDEVLEALLKELRTLPGNRDGREFVDVQNH